MLEQEALAVTHSISDNRGVITVFAEDNTILYKGKPTQTRAQQYKEAFTLIFGDAIPQAIYDAEMASRAGKVSTALDQAEPEFETTESAFDVCAPATPASKVKPEPQADGDKSGISKPGSIRVGNRAIEKEMEEDE